MSHPITIPIFGSNRGQQHQHEDDDADDWTRGMNHHDTDDGAAGDQDMDFDLLAEYLMEDNPGGGGGQGGLGMNFDFP